MGRKINVTKEQQDWLREHYADTLNEELMDALGLKFSTFHRLVRTLGLTKSEAYMNEIHVKASEATAKWWRINRDKVAKKGLPPHLVPYMHKPGDKPWAGGNEEKWREALRRGQEKRRQTVREERARISFGIEQKTAMRLIQQPRKKILDRSYLKRRGYVLDEAEVTAYWTPETRRATRLENRPRRYYKFAPLPQ